jgi:6-pyruvoyltetrahydropterin/6-carboxytetrahydropterin synthase
VTATFESRRWLFPREDCVLLPVENTTAEEIANWIGNRLRDVVKQQTGATIETIQIEVEENFGQWAICEIAV